jgi:hypothetical protein
MITNPESLSHMILVGPPGSGKTTSARYFVERLHGNTGFSSFFGRALFLNSSDERGLEAVRSRVFPFVRSCLHNILQTSQNQAPKIIIFDEAETLTDQAQIALRPLLDKSPKDVLLIFLCNSVSRIHSSILHKFLTIQLEAPSTEEFTTRLQKIESGREETPYAGLDIIYHRGDIRFFLLHPKKHDECAKIWNGLFTLPAGEVREFLEATLQSWIYPELAMFFLVIAKELRLLTYESLKEMLRITDSDFLRLCPLDVRTELLSSWFVKNIIQKL